MLRVARKILDVERVQRYKSNVVMEGGSIHVDGEGTLITTEECLLNPNRNPHLTREQIEAHLREQLAVEKIIWIPHGVFGDEYVAIWRGGGGGRKRERECESERERSRVRVGDVADHQS